ncbi:hypothetical protein IM538_16785 [Cytobacillus suaedae]|nr:hypothetical protein IM538_16785 [Cytobacillus suaedae]
MKLIFIYLALLNAADGAFSYIGLKNGLISEANPLMNHLYTIHPSVFLLTKIALSVFLLLFIIFNVYPKMQWFKTLTVTTTLLYTGTFLLHGFWVYLAFS